MLDAPLSQWILGVLLILSAIGVVAMRKPIYSSLSFLSCLLMLAALYLELSAEFIGIMQVLVYAGAILVIFVFVIVLFQDAHAQIEKFSPLSNRWFLAIAGSAFLMSFILFATRLTSLVGQKKQLPEGFGTAGSIGHALYLDFFFPFEAIILLFLVAIIGSLYIAKKER